MSRPSRYGPKSQSQSNPFDKNGPNGTDAAAAVGLNKARAQFNEPIVQLQAIFPDWKEEDLISVLEEVKGDVELAVARISDGHAEQWGAVKHKKEKKQPATSGGHRERGGERGDRDRDHASHRGISSPRGRGRGGGQRGAGPHSGTSRSQPYQHRDRATNGSSAAPVTSSNADSAWPAAISAKDPAPEARAPDGWGPTTNADTSEDTWAAVPSTTLPEEIAAPSDARQEESVEPTQAAPVPSQEPKSTYALTSITAVAKAQSKPGSSGRSWADIANPSKKPLPVQTTPTSTPVEPPPVLAAHVSVPEAQEPTREEPTTVEAPTWDDEPAVAQPPPLSTQLAAQEQPATTDGWVDANLTTAKSERTESWTDLGGSEQKSDPATWKNITEPAPSTEPVAPAQKQQQQQELQPPVTQVQQPSPNSFSPPPGLANPALSSSPAPPKSTTPSGSRPGFGARPSSRFKTDQAVIMPPSSQGVVAGFAISKSLPLKFGSLDLNGDDNETQPAGDTTMSDQKQNAGEQKQAYGDAQPPSAPSVAADALLTSQSQPSLSPASAYRLQAQQQQQQPQQEEQQPAPTSSVLSGPVHTQAPSINPALAMAPGPGPQHQHHPAASHHTLAGLTHTPQHSGPQGISHSHHPSFGQQGSFPPQQQQHYEAAATAVGGAPFSGLGQSPQGQSQFFRQTDSPFYTQSHTPLAEHGFGGGSAGAFGQGMQTGFNGGPGLGGDFGYDGQRNPYDNYTSPNAFAARGALRQDDAKGLGASPGQGISGHHGNAQPSPLTGQPSGGQGQGQYPGMGHMGNTFYYNMNPYGYANSFYPPAFTSFPMYQAGAQTPPHGAKPGANMNTSAGLGAPGNSAYSATSSGHLQHTSSGFDGDSGPNGASTYHPGGSALPSDFQKGPYAGAQNFLGTMSGASGGVGANRGPGNVAAAGGGVGSTASPETAFKGYGGGGASSLVPAEKSLPTQAGRGAPGVNPGAHQQFYQNNRYSNVPQSQGYPQQQQQQQQQGDGYYSNYQRW